MKNKQLGLLPYLLLMAALAVPFLAACEKDSPMEEEPPPPTPTVSGVSATTLSVGDTVTVTGTDFLQTPGANLVRFNSAVGAVRPFAGSTTELQVEVPQHAATGPVSVLVEGNPEGGVGPAVEIARAVGDVWVWEPTAANASLKVPSPVSSEYLIIPHATNPASSFTEVFKYTLTATEATSLPSPPAGTVARSVATPVLSAQERFEARRREEARQLFDRIDLTRAPEKRPAEAAPAQTTRQFFVYSNINGSTINPSSFTQITAELKATGTWCEVYADQDTLPTGNLALSDFQNFASQFDNTIRPNNTAFFGFESDVDANGKVIILVTPVVNRLSDVNSGEFIGGFFLANDLASVAQGAPQGTTNFAEMFYLLAADPTGVWTFPFGVSQVAEENIRTIAHEYEHLISFAERGFNQNRVFQTTWLEEGMAHMAEDLNDLDPSNINRVNRYFDPPSPRLPLNISLENNQSPLAQRGAIYLFLRWMGDRFGEGIYKQIVESTCVGRECIENITGEDFYLTFADWLASLYLDGRGINASPTYNYTSVSIAGDYRAFPVASRFVGGTAATGDVFRSNGDFYLFTNTTTAVSTFMLTGPTTARLRAVVVRTQ